MLRIDLRRDLDERLVSSITVIERLEIGPESPKKREVCVGSADAVDQVRTAVRAEEPEVVCDDGPAQRQIPLLGPLHPRNSALYLPGLSVGAVPRERLIRVGRRPLEYAAAP